MAKISKAGSLEGYNFLTALLRNKDEIKIVVSVLGTYTAYLGATGFDWKSFLLALGIAVAGLGVKLIQDFVDFLTTDVKLE